jgi:hypothetical protein
VPHDRAAPIDPTTTEDVAGTREAMVLIVLLRYRANKDRILQLKIHR